MAAPEPDAAAFFDERAAVYDTAYDRRGGGGHALRARLGVALRLAGNGPGDALDAGMGPGRLVAELAARGWTLSGVDAAEEMVAVAQRRIPAAAPRLVCAEIERLPFPDASFDLVLATGVLEFADVPRALGEITRVLRPGGRAVVSYPNRGSFYGVWRTRAFDPLARSVKRFAGYSPRPQPRGSLTVAPARFRELLSAAGLELLTSEHTSFLVVLSPLDLLLPRTAEELGRRLEGRGARVPRRLATQVVYSARKPLVAGIQDEPDANELEPLRH
jgi:ubiquinone/menaquinone biosynthesis C-methylase UbiE